MYDTLPSSLESELFCDIFPSYRSENCADWSNLQESAYVSRVFKRLRCSGNMFHTQGTFSAQKPTRVSVSLLAGKCVLQLEDWQKRETMECGGKHTKTRMVP